MEAFERGDRGQDLKAAVTEARVRKRQRAQARRKRLEHLRPVPVQMWLGKRLERLRGRSRRCREGFASLPKCSVRWQLWYLSGHAQ